MNAPSEVFGPIFVTAQIEQSVVDLLKKWYPTYIREIEYQLGKPLGQIPPPVKYIARNRFEQVAGMDNPLVVVISPGFDSPPERTRDMFRAGIGIGVGIAVGHPDYMQARLLSSIYGAAASAIVMHKSSELGMIFRTEFRSLRFDDLELTDQLQQYRSAAAYFVITMENILQWGVGPDTPVIETPPQDWPSIEQVFIDIVKEAL